MKETTMGDWIPTEEIGDMVDFLGWFSNGCSLK